MMPIERDAPGELGTCEDDAVDEVVSEFAPKPAIEHVAVAPRVVVRLCDVCAVETSKRVALVALRGERVRAQCSLCVATADLREFAVSA